MSYSHSLQLNNKKRRNLLLSIAAVFVVVSAGLIYQISRGAGFSIFLDPTTMNVGGNASLVADTSLTSGKALRFGDAPPPTPPPTPAPGGQIAPNTLPAGNDVGFLGDAAKLVVADAANVPAGLKYNSAGGFFELASATTRTFQGYKFTRPVVLTDSLSANAGITLTFKGNVFAMPGNQPYGGITYQSSLGTNNFIIQDNTFTSSALTGIYGNGQIQMDARCTIQRNNISGRSDGIQNGSGQCLIEQNYIHSPALYGKYPDNTHNDGIQFYSGSGIQVRYNRIDIGWDGEHQNGALFFQGNFSAPVIDNNFLSGGGIILRLESGVSGAIVTNNTFKLSTGSSASWGPYTHDTNQVNKAVATWSGNNMFPSSTLVNK